MNDIKSVYYDAMRAKNPISQDIFILDYDIFSLFLDISIKHEPQALLKLPDTILLELPPNSFGIWLKKSRKFLGFTQDELSTEAGVTQCEISLLERGTTKKTKSGEVNIGKSPKGKIIECLLGHLQ